MRAAIHSDRPARQLEQPIRQLSLKEFRELLSRCAFVVVERAKKKARHVSKPMIAAPKFIHKSF
jgi:hypothetical protein